MGNLSRILPQGPNQHCGSTTPHDKHPNPSTLYATAWCDGVPVLEPFLELTIRIPLVQSFVALECTHEELIAEIRHEGLGTFVLDEWDSEETRVALRVRWGGEDRFYQVVKGRVQ